MVADMHEFKLVLELERLPPYVAAVRVEPEIANIDFPAWRALFTSLVLWGHSTGYRLPDFDRFFGYCEQAYRHERHHRRFDRWFDPADRRRTEQRFRRFYESGMAETHLYTCLVDAFEDVLKDGMVLYDARADWKQKWDVTVITRGQVFVVDSFTGSGENRAAVKRRRDAVEHQRKRNTAASAHWGNQERPRCIELQIERAPEDCQVVNGVPLFSMRRINCLLAEIYETTGAERRYFFPEDRDARRQEYLKLVKTGD